MCFVQTLSSWPRSSRSLRRLAPRASSPMGASSLSPEMSLVAGRSRPQCASRPRSRHLALRSTNTPSDVGCILSQIFSVGISPPNSDIWMIEINLNFRELVIWFKSVYSADIFLGEDFLPSKKMGMSANERSKLSLKSGNLSVTEIGMNPRASNNIRCPISIIVIQ